ncbi:MAG: hypothetical protein ABIN89_16605 [Chitinophagaceae bacterium]
MYDVEDKSYFVIFDYGSIVFFGVDDNSQTNIIYGVRRTYTFFENPNLTWNDEYLNIINTDPSRELDIKLRHSSLQDSLSTVRVNLEILKDINQHSHSSKLELIVIVLIAIEILNILIDKLL